MLLPIQQLMPKARHLVVLDTNVVLDLAVKSKALPDWYPTLCDAKRWGCEFCLAGGTYVEFMDHWASERKFSNEEIRLAVKRVDRLLAPELPILPDSGDIFAMAGIRDKSFTPEPFADVVRKSQGCWELVRRFQTFEELRDAGALVTEPDEVLDKKKLEYVQKIDEVKSLESKLNVAEGPPPIERILVYLMEQYEERFEATVPIRPRIEPLIRAIHKRVHEAAWPSSTPYNAEKNRNDAIDVMLFECMALGALVVTGEKKWVEFTRSWACPQSGWMLLPGEFRSAWDARALPRTHFN